MSEVTHILNRAAERDPKAADELLPLVYQELRRLAAYKLAQQRPGQTLQATALVHEAWLKLANKTKKQWESRQHFVSAAAEAMRHILVDRARKKQTARHGGGQERVDLDSIEIPASFDDSTVLSMNEALNEFEEIDPTKARVVKLKFFIGLSEREIAELLDVSERTIERYWAYAQAWLFERMDREESPPDELS